MERPDDLKAAKRFTRETVETALVLLEETQPGFKRKGMDAAMSLYGERDFLFALDTAAALATCARTVRAVATNECNGYHYEWQEEADKKREARALKRARKLLAPWGVEFKAGGDPRGACFYLQTPKSGRHNTWGGASTGWAVV